MNILILEDSVDIALGIKAYLENRNFSVDAVHSICDAKRILTREFDLIILDINLPDGNGKDFFRYVKQRFDVPVIFLTVKNNDGDVIEGLDLGADDYITKPVKLAVLYSRIKNIFRRTKRSVSNDLIILGNYKIDTTQKRVFNNDVEIELTAQEYNLLKVFMENANQTLTRERLLELIWDSNENFVSDNTLTATIRRLRKKLNADILKTIHGIGYRLEV